MLFCCSLPKFGKVPTGQSNILHPKLSQIAHNFSATFGFFERNFLGGLIGTLENILIKTMQGVYEEVTLHLIKS